MDINNLKQTRKQLIEQKESKLVELGMIIGKIELLDVLIGQIEGEGQTSPLSLDDFKNMIGADAIEEPKPV